MSPQPTEGDRSAPRQGPGPSLPRTVTSSPLRRQQRPVSLDFGRGATAVSPGAGHLPAPVSRFIGRTRELAELEDRLASARLLTLTGPGGSGKTRLALRLAERMLQVYGERTWFVDLAGLTDPGRVAATVALTLDCREEPGQPLERTLARRIGRAPTLLILDNCERILAGCAALAEELLRLAERLTIVATSREPLRLLGEHIYAVPPLGVPGGKAAGDARLAARHESIELFVDRAKLVQPRFALDPRNVRPVAAICRQLDGIPLAIELAAARMKVLSVHQIEEKLKDRFRLLRGGSRTAPRRHQALRAAIDWSYEQLGADEQAVYKRLSVCVGGCTLEAAQAIAGQDWDELQVLDLLTELVDKSLMVLATRSTGESSYIVLETLRQYARERLEESGEAPAALDRHLDHFLDLAGRARPELRGPEQDRWLERLEEEHDNFLAAFDWCVHGDGSARKALQLGWDLGRFWETRSHYTIGREKLRQALERAEGSAELDGDRAKVMAVAGTLAWGQRDYDEARVLFEGSLTLSRLLDDRRGVAVALGNLGLLAKDDGDGPLAKRRFEECLDIFRALGDQSSVARTLGNLGITHRLLGDFESAQRYQQESLVARRELGDTRGIVVSLNSLALLGLDRGEPAAVRPYLREALELVRELGDIHTAATTIDRAALMQAMESAWTGAMRLHAAACALRRSVDVDAEMFGEEPFLHARERLGAEFERVWTSGAELSFEEALDEALEAAAKTAPSRPESGTS